MPIFGRPDFQGDFNSGVDWLTGNPLDFLMTALKQGNQNMPAGVPGILGGLGRGAPTGPGGPAFGLPDAIYDPTGSSGVTPSAPLGGGMGSPALPTPPRQPPIEPSGLLPRTLTNLQAGPQEPIGEPMGPGPLPSGPMEAPGLPSIPGLSRAFGPAPTDVAPPGGETYGAKTIREAIEKANAGSPKEVPWDYRFGMQPEGGFKWPKLPTSAADFLKPEDPDAMPPTEWPDWVPKPEEGGGPAEAGEPGKPPPPFSKTMPAKTGPTGVPGAAGQEIRVPAGGEAGPAARIKVTPQQRKDMIQTVLGEAGDEPQKGKEAVAHVIINRALENKPDFGGSDVSSVIKKPYQFEPWNTAAGRAKMAGYPETSKDYKDAAKAVDDAIAGKKDPTGGSTFFYSPVGQASLGRAKPNWASKDRFATKIGGHEFYYGATGKPIPPPEGAEEGEVTEPQQAQYQPPDQSGRVTPQLPMLPMPPSQAQVPRTDFGPIRAMLDKAGYITPGENMANVLAGLAGGAGSVAANQPGSFAAALAAAGAGGERAFAGGLKSGREAIGQRAAAELPLLAAERAENKDYTSIEFQNATNKYNTVVQNLNNDYTGRKQEFAWLQPDIKFDANGMHVTRYDPQTGEYVIQNVPLRDKMQQYEQLSSMAKALGIDHPYIRMKVGQMLLDDMPEDLRAGFVKNLAVQDVVSSGAAGAVFKEAWTQALKQAEKQIDPSLKAKPDVYDAKRNEIATALILNNPSINNPLWLEDAAKAGSPWAAWMLQNLKSAKAKPPKEATPKAEPAEYGY